jgi:endonuclease YncB( thermonuclease family)
MALNPLRPGFLIPCALFVVAAAAGAPMFGEGPKLFPGGRLSGGSFACRVRSVHDGDTLTCSDGLRVRLAGIDARETDGSCAPGHPCAEAPPEAATAALEHLALGWDLICQDEGRTYNRRAGFCRRSADGLDISCAMLASGTVAKWARYWRGHRC